jgi:hypothetical protein
LKVCYKVAKENSKHQNPSNSLSKKLKAPKLAFFNPKYLGLGEDFGIDSTYLNMCFI